jgi:nucleotide-binding universal stress UspA family protein
MKIVIAIDGSEQNKVMLQDVAKRSWKDGTELMLLNVIEAPAFDFMDDFGTEPADQIRSALKENSDELLEESVRYLKNSATSPPTIHKASSVGQPVDSIVKVATDWEADLIIVGSHGRGGLVKFFLGSVAEAVVARSPCSVEIVRNQPQLHEAPKRKRSVVLY